MMRGLIQAQPEKRSRTLDLGARVKAERVKIDVPWHESYRFPYNVVAFHGDEHVELIDQWDTCETYLTDEVEVQA